MRGYIVHEDKRFVYLEKLLAKAGDYTDYSFLDYKDFDYIVFGLKGPDERGRYQENRQTHYLPDDFFASLKKGCCLYSFVTNPYLRKMADQYQLNYYAFETNEKVINGNADLTSEAVLAYVIEHRPKRLKGSRVSILGYGHLAKSLISYFQPYAQEMYVVCRNPDYDEEIQRFAQPSRFEGNDYLKSDIIINTVPVRLLDAPKLSQINKDSLLIDVSSFPYGFDMNDISQLRLNAQILPGLPGKYAYQDAAKLLYYAIMEGKNV